MMKQLNLKSTILNGVNLLLKKGSLQTMVCSTLLLSSVQSVFSHGTVTSPPSRVWNCFQEGPENLVSPACIAARIGYGTQAFYDWSEVARMDAGGDHRAILGPGNLASAGRPDKYGGLDQVRNDWVATPVNPGAYTVTWTNQAPHKTLYYDVYITKASWTPDQPLTWDVLELLTRTGPRDAAVTDNIPVILPKRSGKHVIFSVWQRSLTPEAFYSTSDVDFGPGEITDVPNNTPPVANIKIASVNGRNVTFDTTGSTDAEGGALTYRFNYGDGTQDQNVGATPTHSYNNSRESFKVIVTVSDKVGLSDTATIVVNFGNIIIDDQMNNDPIANLVVTKSTTDPFMVNFDASGSTDADGDTLSYDIIYGDGNMATNLNVNSVYKYTSDGTYTATLTVRDGKGGVDTDTATFIIESVDPDLIYSEITQDDLSDDANAPSGPFTLKLGANSIEATQSGSPRDIDYFTITIPQGLELSGLIVSEFSDTANIGFIGVTTGNTSAPQTGVGLLGGTLFGGTIGANLLGTPASVSGPGFSDSLEAGTYTVWLNQTSGTTTTKLNFEVSEAIVITPIDPVANLIVTPSTTGTAPFTVNFDASGSTDANGDSLTYNIDYGNENSGTNLNVNSTYTYTEAGTYTATLTVDDGNGGTDTASVTITVNGVDPIEGDCTFGTPTSTPLASIQTSYPYAYVLGAGGPDLSSFTNLHINWDATNNGLYHLAFNFNAAPWYLGVTSSTQNFNEANPKITFSNTGITGLDGEYFAALDNGNLALVANGYTIYFSKSNTAPNCDSATGAKNFNDKLLSASLFPNPASGSVSIQNNTDLKDSIISIYDLSGKEIKSISVQESTTNLTIDISGITTGGLYLVKVSSSSGSSRTLNLLVK